MGIASFRSDQVFKDTNSYPVYGTMQKDFSTFLFYKVYPALTSVAIFIFQECFCTNKRRGKNVYFSANIFPCYKARAGHRLALARAGQGTGSHWPGQGRAGQGRAPARTGQGRA